MSTKLSEKLYYSIGEVAEAFDVNPSLIRFGKKEFNFPQKNQRKGKNLLPKKDKNFPDYFSKGKRDP
ncbi:MAG: hypothetical protein CM15mP83_5420 [Flavobacteriaceae bacterium]|nr:MAG: hypothetical protein CM15mP83_5420 [Flavobacteriaceae bacterium]